MDKAQGTGPRIKGTQGDFIASTSTRLQLEQMEAIVKLYSSTNYQEDLPVQIPGVRDELLAESEGLTKGAGEGTKAFRSTLPGIR